jgi:hypothetical protein
MQRHLGLDNPWKGNSALAQRAMRVECSEGHFKTVSSGMTNRVGIRCYCNARIELAESAQRLRCCSIPFRIRR